MFLQRASKTHIKRLSYLNSTYQTHQNIKCYNNIKKTNIMPLPSKNVFIVQLKPYKYRQNMTCVTSKFIGVCSVYHFLLVWMIEKANTCVHINVVTIFILILRSSLVIQVESVDWIVSLSELIWKEVKVTTACFMTQGPISTISIITLGVYPYTCWLTVRWLSVLF